MWCEWRGLVDALLITISIISVIALAAGVLGESIIGSVVGIILLIMCIVTKTHLPDTINHTKYKVAYKQCRDFLGSTTEKYTCDNYALVRSDTCKSLHREEEGE